MTDLEMVRKCAEAMGLVVVEQLGGLRFINTQFEDSLYDPLTDDAQAMALVRKFRIGLNPWAQGWEATLSSSESEFCRSYATNADLNRAIVSCVAKMNGSGE